MGAWGAGVIGDDTSLDWLEEDHASSRADAVACARVDIGAWARATLRRMISGKSGPRGLWNDGGSDPERTAAMSDERPRFPS